MVAVPDGWTPERVGSTSAVFRHDAYELSLKIEPRYRSSTSRRRSGTQQPTSYRVQVLQDWFAKGVHGDHSMSANVETWDAALETAQTFMSEFTDERTTQSTADVEATHRSVGDAETAEHLLTTEASAEALADAVGYSDELLLEVLEEETDGQYRVVAHRDGDRIEYVYGGDDEYLETVPLESIYATFPIDKLGLDTLLLDSDTLTSTFNIDNAVVYRFITGEGDETDIVLPEGTQVVSPTFERTIWNVLEERA